MTASDPGITFSSVLVKSATTITAKATATAAVPAAAYAVIVTLPSGSASCAGYLNVVPQPTVSSISPSTLAQGATSVSAMVTGADFWAPAHVAFTGPGKGVNGKVTSVGSMTLSVKVSVAQSTATGVYTLKLTNGDGGVASCIGCVTIVTGPAITSISPASVSRREKTSFTLTGSGFRSDAKLVGPTGVAFSALNVSADGTTITATITVSASAPTGTNLPVTVKDGPLGNYGTTTDRGLTIT